MRAIDITTNAHQTYNKPECSMIMAQAVESRLLTLVDELQLGIIEYVESKDDLSNLAITCSRLQTLAEPLLYRSILVRKGEQALLLYRAFLIKPIRASFIRKLEIRYLYDYRKGIVRLNQCLRLSCNLRELTIEAPCCNDTQALIAGFASKGEIDYADYFAFASAMTLEAQPRVQVPLQTFILHSHNEMGIGRNAFDMGRNAVIFLHPTLRNLTISCFDIGEDLEVYLSGNQKTTPLKSLTFDECNISVQGLTTILTTPKSLERLTLGERMFHLSGYTHPPLGHSPELLLQALALQQDSLYYLKHIGGFTELPDRHSGMSMISFRKMRQMELSTHSIITRVFRESSPPWARTIPADLQILRLVEFCLSSESESSDMDILPSLLEWLSRVPQLDYIIDSHHVSFADRIKSLQFLSMKEEGEKPVWKKILALLGMDFEDFERTPDRIHHLRIIAVRPTKFIPPYMYGETPPKEIAIFDSETVIPKLLKKRAENKEEKRLLAQSMRTSNRRLEPW